MQMVEKKAGKAGAARRPFRHVDFCVLVLGLLGTVACMAALFILGAGCASKKSALTSAEVKRMTLAQKPQRPDQLIVCGETITWEDVLMSPLEQLANVPPLKEGLEKLAQETPHAQFLEQARPVVQLKLNRIIRDIVLARQGKRELGTKLEDSRLDAMAEKELRRFVVAHGSNGAAADAALAEMGMNRATYKEYVKRQSLKQYIIAAKDIRDEPITYGNLVTRYDEMKDQYYLRPGVVQFRLIDIQPARMALTDPNGDPLAAARRRAAELRRRIDAGADFAALAKQYSHDVHSAEGGLWKPRDPNSLAAPYDLIGKAVQTMKPGAVAGPIETETFGHIFLVKLEEKREPHYQPLSEVQEEVRANIVDQREKKMEKDLLVEVTRQIALADTDRFVDYCLERMYRQVHESPAAPVAAPAPAVPTPLGPAGSSE
jgi:parvulin-like peptidyl-prolyl isomerase